MLFARRDKLKLGVVVFEITDACNQACKFCYNHFKGCEGYCAPAAPDYDMARRTLKRLLDEASIASLSLSGGEPMLMPNIHDLVLKARFTGANVNILTNGTLLSDNDVKIFDDLGVGLIQIPILSSDAQIHDALTTIGGTWERAMRGARRVAERRKGWLAPVLIITRQNLDTIESTLELYAELGATNILVNRFNVGGLGIGNASELSLSHRELRAAFKRADTKLRELGLRAHSGVCTPMCVLNPKEYSNITFTHCTTELMSRPLTINYRGEVRFCNHSPRVLGNIHDMPLATILEQSQADGYFDKRPAECASCRLWEQCRGGCRAASEQLYGTFDRVDPILSIENHK